jgi:hypothetical protein
VGIGTTELCWKKQNRCARASYPKKEKKKKVSICTDSVKGYQLKAERQAVSGGPSRGTHLIKRETNYIVSCQKESPN